MSWGGGRLVLFVWFVNRANCLTVNRASFCMIFCDFSMLLLVVVVAGLPV